MPEPTPTDPAKLDETTEPPQPTAPAEEPAQQAEEPAAEPEPTPEPEPEPTPEPAPVEDDTTQLDTAKHRTPDEDLSQESTPIADEVAAYLKDAKAEDVTRFAEDENPTQYVGEEVQND